jgi:TonB-linked SusC/RagA family outer membrane protein
MSHSLSRVLAAACLGVSVPAVVQAQQAATISGRVTTDAGQPLAAASVFIQTLGVGTTTRDDGTFSFTVPGGRVTGQTVTISARRVGYRTESAQIALRPGAITQNFSLGANALQLGEVVVVGAGLSTTAERLGAVRTAVDTQALVRANEPNVVQALAGKAPGIVVNQQAGDPGASSKIIIRGMNTIQGTGQPLFVVDGTPINNQTISTSGGSNVGGGTVTPNRAYDINPDDIESIEVLKSAAAAAIYGARASQGVILITTKKGRAGQTNYSLRTTVSSDEVNRLPPLQRQFNLGTGGVTAECTNVNCQLPGTSWGAPIPAGTPTFDQARAIFENGSLLEGVLQASGGNERTQFFLSGSNSNQQGVIVGDRDFYRRQTFRLNGTHRLNSAFSASGNVSYVDSRGGFVQRGSNTSGITLGGWRTTPTFDNRNFLDSATGLHRSYRFPRPGPTSTTRSRVYDNPFFVIDRQQNTSNAGRAFGNINLNYTPASWLTLAYTLGADYTSDERLEGRPQTSSAFPQGDIRRGNYVTYIVDHLLNAQASHEWRPGYETRFALGTEFNSQRFQQNQVFGQQLVVDGLYTLPNAITVTPDVDNLADYRSLIRRESYFGQLQQGIANDLFLTFTLRNDGFSTFGENNRRNWFPSAQAAYVFTNRFNPGGFLTDGKLRASYGQTGSEPGVYLTRGFFSSGNYAVGGWGDQLFSTQNGQGGLAVATRVSQPNLRPERQNEFEAGFDVGVLRNRADLSLTYYNRTARDVIFDVPLAPSSGFGLQARNAAKIRNAGVEASINVRAISTPNTELTLGFVYAQNRNRVLSLIGADAVELPTGGYFNGSPAPSAITNYSLGVFRGVDFARCGRGLGQLGGDDVAAACQGAPAGALYIGEDGYPIEDPEVRPIGDPTPIWTGGFRPTLRLRRFTVSALADIRRGGKVWNGTKGALYFFGAHQDENIRGNSYVIGQTYTPGRAIKDARPEPVVGPGAGNSVEIGEDWFTTLGNGFAGPVGAQFLEDGSFVKLREVSVGYSFTQPALRRALGLSSIDLRVAGRNLGLWTDYTGIDPETNLGGAEVGAQGIDYFNTPLTRSFVFTVSFNR